MNSSLFSLAFGVAILLVSSVAGAGCPNLCEMTSEKAELEKEISCVHLQSANVSECDCEVNLAIENQCAQPIRAVGFVFDRCGDGERECSQLVPGDIGMIDVALIDVGTERHAFPIAVDEESTTITLVTDVESFHDAGCSFGEGSRGAQMPLLVLIAAVFMYWRRRRTTVL